MAAGTRRWPGILAALFGLAMAIAVTKFGNPIIFKSLESAPTNIWEFVLATWPATWSFRLAVVLALLSVATNWRHASYVSRPLFFLLGGWAFWVAFSMSRSVDIELSQLAVKHFSAITVLFFLAVTFLPSLAEAKNFFRVMVLALAFALWVGFDQHYGGLEATRKAFYELPNWESFPPEYKLKIASTRIFGPFIYPNTFAGAILIWAPVLTLALWEWTQRLPSIAQKVLVGLFVYAVAACFFWTGSKAGWLIAIAVFTVALLHLKNLKRPAKIGIIAAVVVFGLAGFALKYRSYFEKGATSAGARVIYWKAAIQIANDHPILGAGPGTFAKTFALIKPSEAEMARLVHNDYLEQACDSGWPAFVLFIAFVGTAMFLSHRTVSKSPYHLAAWLGLLGWALQSFVEFGLYIPAISWSAFGLLGWLAGSRIEVDTTRPAK
jgi:O-antigen ligase